MRKSLSDVLKFDKHLAISAAVVVVIVLLDQLTKWLTVKFLDENESIEVIKDVFHFTYIRNQGAAFGMLSNTRWVFMIISTVAIVGLSVYLWKFAPKSYWITLPVSFIIGGGIGNMIDRLFRYDIGAHGEKYYYVVDFLDFRAFPEIWEWVFNVADSFVCVGAAILFVWCLVTMKDEFKPSKNKVPSEEKEGTDTE